MLVVTAWCKREQEQLINLLNWSIELGGAKGHSLLLVSSADMPEEDRNQAYGLAAKIYDRVDVIRAFYEDPRPWPVNANLMFQRAYRHVSDTFKCPFFWQEPDCIPLAPNWLDIWEDEYRRCGKPLMGCVVREPLHLSGNAVYSMDYIKFSPHPLLAETTAWDVVDAARIVPHAHHSTRYFHLWSYKSPHQDPYKYDPLGTHFENRDDLKQIPDDAIWMHRNKDGSLIRLLREKRIAATLPAIEVKPDPPPPPPVAPTPAPPRTMGILVRTWTRDAPWLDYSFRSIIKYCSGFARVLVVSPDDDVIRPIADRFKFDYRHATDKGAPTQGYLHQQITKMQADLLMPDCDYILHHDSDCLFCQPVTPATYLPDDRVLWLMEQYSTLNGSVPWQAITEKALGRPVEYEFMRRHPMVCPRWLYPAARQKLTDVHRVLWDDYILAQPGNSFSEINYLGAYAFYCQVGRRSQFRFLNISKADPAAVPPPTVRQFWSWGGITLESQKEMQSLLA